jgi:hypothetical protein
MTPRQIEALRRPCARSDDATADVYVRERRIDRRRSIRSILTVNK